VPNRTLTGYRIQMGNVRADHTYAASDDGRVWPCFGRSSGGSPICSGSGNVDRADCLSQPQSSAGLVYGVTGVCHQAANRILYPSSKMVSAARGYRWSVFTYGVYGNDIRTFLPYSPKHTPWPQLAACNAHHP
jgi:hypothetical protein